MVELTVMWPTLHTRSFRQCRILVLDIVHKLIYSQSELTILNSSQFIIIKSIEIVPGLPNSAKTVSINPLNTDDVCKLSPHLLS